MAKQTVTALYDSREYANNAVLMLRQAGVSNADVTVSPEAAATGYADAAEPQAKGFWASLENLLGATDDHYGYAEGIRRGGILVTAHVDDAKVDDVVEILDRHGSIDLNERKIAWRSEGWTGGPAITGDRISDTRVDPMRSIAPVGEIDTAVSATGVLSAPSSTRPYRSAIAPTNNTARTQGQDEVVQVFEETAEVTKRAVLTGKVRVSTRTEIHNDLVEVNLDRDVVEVTRVPIGRVVEVAPTVRTDDEITIVPVIEERFVVVKQLFLVEELHIRRKVEREISRVPVQLRRQLALVERLDPQGRVKSDQDHPEPDPNHIDEGVVGEE